MVDLLKDRPFFVFACGEGECLAEIAESAEIVRLAANFRSHRNHGNHRNFYSLTLINGGLRPWAASQLWGTQMAQMTQIVFRAFLKLVIGRNYLYLPTEIMDKGRAMHILLGSLEFGSQVFETFSLCGSPCDGVEE